MGRQILVKNPKSTDRRTTWQG